MTTVTVDQGDAYVPKALEAGRLPEELKRRAQDWGGSAEEPCVPAEAGGGFLIATVDVQAGGRPSFVVHVYLVSGGDIWHVDMFKIRKSRRKDDDDDHHLIDPGSHPEDWDVLIDQVIERDYPIGDTGRRMQIKIVACDSGGADGVTANAYAFYRRLRAGTAIAKKRLPPVKPHLQKYLEYIRNTGRDPLPIAQFDEDWEPIGKQVREELLGAGAINWDKGNLWIDYVTTEPTGLHRRFHLLKGSPSRTETAPLRLTYPDAQQKDRLAIARGDVPVWLVNSNIVKDQASNMLGREEAGGAVRFPSWAPDWLYTQLTTEIREPKGWTNPSRRRNEAFDLLAYAIAMQRHPDLRTHVVGFWDAPPDWAGPWDVNSLVYTPTPEGGRRFEAPQASRPSLADLADKLG
jgi:phage terminase large subunit GpA-like protein